MTIYAITDEIVDKTIEIRRDRKPKVADAIIAATAILQGLSLISRNEKDFKDLPGLILVNPFDLEGRMLGKKNVWALPFLS